MSRGVNEATLIGNVGDEPEIRTTTNGNRVGKFSLATNRSWTDKSGAKQEETDWHRITVFGRLVDVVESWVHKGDRLYIRGRIQYSKVEGEGGTKYFTDIIVNDLVLLGVANAEKPEPAGRDGYDLPY